MGQQPQTTPAPELWAGVECTVNRVGDRYFEQLERSGHARRAGDLDLLKWLGATAARYPVLWERTAPGELKDADWTWPDGRLGRLRELGLRPIVGLLHHGSGPPHTCLTDDDFPEKLAAYARAVAERYPWVGDYTPVNEPLTTARFSGLYGHWYPHGRSGRTFARALLNELRGVVLAMRAVREVNPAARLVQTEDVGKCFSTERLSYQAEFENERRWLTYDLLAGRVTRDHPLWPYLLSEGVGAGELDWFAENACPPSVVGVNYYVSSERFLDERVERYPPRTRGGNGRDAYADTEAARVVAGGVAGAGAILREAWDRYGLPLALTEAHMGCTREEQMRWVHELWAGACEARAAGADVRAVTAWAVFGSFDWDSLVTCDRGHYEPGAFDVRSPEPRPTAVGRMLRDLASAGAHDHPALDAPGWWRRLERLIYAGPSRRAGSKRTRRPAAAGGAASKGAGAASRTLLVAGATGTLGAAFARAAESRALSCRLLSRREMDIADAASVEAALEGSGAWAVVNAAGYVRVDDAEREAEACMRENASGAATLAGACARRGLRLLTFSSDLVFDGRNGGAPYVESDAVSPLNVYGRSKAEAERRVLEACPGALVVRTSAFFGPWDEHNFVTLVLRLLSRGEEFVAADDYVVTPTYVPELAHACLDLLIDGEGGLWHLANGGALTWAEFARMAARHAGLDERLVVGRPTRELGLAAARPAHSALGSERGALLGPLEDALAAYVRERGEADASAPGRRARAASR
ncbi:MAG TPA: sugar nucleotide-binding protein [Pyrinomonadaceae bacterium]|jgi:dTDP-4-dehydrorhamnose reductase